MLDHVAPGVWSVRIPMPNPHNPSVLCYLIEDAAGDLHLIDSGLPGMDSLAVLEDALGALDRTPADVRSISVTHLHRDHLGLAGTVRSAGGAVVRLHADDAAARSEPVSVTADELTGFGVPRNVVAGLLRSFGSSGLDPVEIDAPLVDGELLGIPGRDLRVVHTPGHTWGHVAIVSETDRLVFTGDHVLPDQFAGIGLGGGSTANPIRAFSRLARAPARVRRLHRAAGHGWVFDGLDARIDEILEHHGRRTAEVAAVLAKRPAATVWEIASQLHLVGRLGRPRGHLPRLGATPNQLAPRHRAQWWVAWDETSGGPACAGSSSMPASSVRCSAGSA